MIDDERFHEAIWRFDEANDADPNRTDVEGIEFADELLYAMRMTLWLSRLYPDASVPLRLAARSQHLCRWTIPRNQYPMDRAGYHRWRTDLAKFHAEKAGEILRTLGYDDTTILRVQSLLRKERLKDDPETQALEDVACLVFLEYEFADFASKHEDEKVITILQRTWKKMSDTGREAALKLSLTERASDLIARALAS